MSLVFWQFQTIRFGQIMNLVWHLTFFTEVSNSEPLLSVMIDPFIQGLLFIGKQCCFVLWRNGRYIHSPDCLFFQHSQVSQFCYWYSVLDQWIFPLLMQTQRSRPLCNVSSQPRQQGRLCLIWSPWQLKMLVLLVDYHIHGMILLTR